MSCRALLRCSLLLSVAAAGGGTEHSARSRMRSCFSRLQQVHGPERSADARHPRQSSRIPAIHGPGQSRRSREHPLHAGAMRRRSSRSRASTTRTPQFEKICGAQVHGAALRPEDRSSPKTPRSASINSSFPTFPAPIRWSGSRRAKPRRSARRRASAFATRMNGRAPARASLRAARLSASTSPRSQPPNAGGRTHARRAQPRRRRPTKSWSYGPEYQNGICATGSNKTPGCHGGSWTAMRLQYLSRRRFSRPATARSMSTI